MIIVLCFVFIVRKASQEDKKKKDRKLSIHVALPQDAEPSNSCEISVVNPEREDSLLLGKFLKIIMIFTD